MPFTKSAKLLCGGQAVKAKTSAPGGLDSKPGDSLSPIEQAEQAIEGYLSRESSLCITLNKVDYKKSTVMSFCRTNKTEQYFDIAMGLYFYKGVDATQIITNSHLKVDALQMDC